jgi:hypothetical protein
MSRFGSWTRGEVDIGIVIRTFDEKMFREYVELAMGNGQMRDAEPIERFGKKYMIVFLESEPAEHHAYPRSAIYTIGLREMF